MRFKVGGFSPENYKKITEASSLVYDWPVFIDDTPGLSYMEIARRARKAKKAHEIEMVIIDYLQLVKGDQGQGKNYEIESITRGLKGLAKDLNVPVLLLSQLNRQCETRPHPYKRPQLSDLRDSGAIEQDADIVIFLYRPEHYDEKDKKGKDQPGIAEINIAKHRNGLTGGIKLMWKKEVMKFQNLEGSINGQP
jgi:replicative DNA helicase